MTNLSEQEMVSACHALAEYILRQPTLTNRSTWLKHDLAKLLTDRRVISNLATRYAEEYRYSEVPTEYLAKTLEAFDEEVG